MPRSITQIRLAVFALYDLDHFLSGCNINTVAVKYLKSQRKPFTARHQTDTDLRAIRSPIATIASFGLRVALSVSLKIR